MTAPPSIAKLPEAVANQIAAGEVVERPAAVVKELAENAIDAGATHVRVEVAAGGRRLVRVVDDGHGMAPADLALAVERHATSKLAVAADLTRIDTLGFRGEALPSIAAVSEFTLASRPAGSTAGHELRLRGGEPAGSGARAMPAGTRIEVRNLFWNVPARLKFLKSERAEGGAITDLVLRLALGHPAIGFELRADDKPVLDFPAGQTLEGRLRGHFHREVCAGLLPVAADGGGMQLEGFVGHPRLAKASGRKRLYFFLNGRALDDALVAAAVREGYAGNLEPRLHVPVVLHLLADPGQVDVNVHPTKAEVRFRRGGEVFALIRDAIGGALAEHAGGFAVFGPDAAAPQKPAVPSPGATDGEGVQERFLPPPAPQVRGAADAPEMPAGAEDAATVAETGPSLYADPLAGVRQIVQLADAYLLVETAEGIRLVDQHALHEKILYLELTGRMAAELRDGGRQELLVPLTVELDAAEVAAVEDCLPALRERGIEAEVCGPGALALRAHPARLRRVDWPLFFRELAARGDADDALAALAEDLAHRRACAGAVKAGDPLPAADLRELVALLHRLEHLEQCPHGRPTTIDLSWEELGRRFGR